MSGAGNPIPLAGTNIEIRNKREMAKWGSHENRPAPLTDSDAVPLGGIDNSSMLHQSAVSNLKSAFLNGGELNSYDPNENGPTEW